MIHSILSLILVFLFNLIMLTFFFKQLLNKKNEFCESKNEFEFVRLPYVTVRLGYCLIPLNNGLCSILHLSEIASIYF